MIQNSKIKINDKPHSDKNRHQSRSQKKLVEGNGHQLQSRMATEHH